MRFDIPIWFDQQTVCDQFCQTISQIHYINLLDPATFMPLVISGLFGFLVMSVYKIETKRQNEKVNNEATE